MHDSFFICCGVDGCERKEARAVIEGALTGEPIRTIRSFPVSLDDGEWWAYRGRDARVERVYCPDHHPDAVWLEGWQAA